MLVYRSNARGIVQRVDTARVLGTGDVTFDLDFTYFGDGGWYWFDLASEAQDFELVEAAWYAPEGTTPPRGAGTASVAITTYNRAEYCAELLADIGASDDVREILDRVYVIDQGTENIVDAAGYPAARAALGDKLEVIRQANLGGSGGFSRGMLETLRAKSSDYVLLLDDDIKIEPESIHRAVRFADYALKPTIVGGHMFDMYDKTVLHAFAEAIEMRNFMWGPTTPHRHKFATSNLRQTPWLHRRVDAQYNGWWMSLIPVSIVEEIGLSLPVFIKWDDAEYALRAADHGYPLVSLPGSAVWHVSWVDKDDSQDWQAFFHARNRLVAALLHSPLPHGGRLALANLATDIRQLVSMQYFAVAARQAAYLNVLEGPEQLQADMTDRQGKVRALAQEFSDGRVLKDKNAYPPIVAQDIDEHARQVRRTRPRGLDALIVLAPIVLRNLFVPVPKEAEVQAQAHLAFEDAKWWVVQSYDSVLISNAEGSGAIWHRRNRKLFRSLLWNNWRLGREIRKQWPELRKRYRRALPDFVSREAWEKSLFPKQ